MKKVIRPKSVKGIGVVGFWNVPKDKLGGTLPRYLTEDIEMAVMEAEKNERLKEFQGKTPMPWLCEITIKPLGEIKKRTAYTVSLPLKKKQKSSSIEK